jgi:hypothetical protein
MTEALLNGESRILNLPVGKLDWFIETPRFATPFDRCEGCEQASTEGSVAVSGDIKLGLNVYKPVPKTAR